MTAFGIVLAHFVGDYLIQSHWMAVKKTSQWLPAILHGLTYTIPFIFVTQSPAELITIAGTHIIIDRFRLAKYLVWFKNQIAPKTFRPSWKEASTNSGFSSDTPVWLATWLMIIADNILHILINFAAIFWL